MRFCDAIRKGAKIRPQGFGQGFDGVRTCANSAARDGVGLLNFQSEFDALFPITEIPCNRCPVCKHLLLGFTQNFKGLVAHLNDNHRWTREHIADWIEDASPKDWHLLEQQDPKGLLTKQFFLTKINQINEKDKPK